MRINYFRTIITIILCGVISISILGCAASSASYAASNDARDLKISETKSAGTELVRLIVIAPRFQAFVKKMKDKNRETVVLLHEPINTSDDPSWSGVPGIGLDSKDEKRSGACISKECHFGSGEN